MLAPSKVRFEAAKAHSAVEAWANALQDALEQAMAFSAEWLGEKPTTEVSVHTDFGVDLDGGADMDGLSKMQMAGQISRETLWDELLRRGKLGPQFDPLLEEERLATEVIDAPGSTTADAAAALANAGNGTGNGQALAA